MCELQYYFQISLFCSFLFICVSIRFQRPDAPSPQGSGAAGSTTTNTTPTEGTHEHVVRQYCGVLESQLLKINPDEMADFMAQNLQLVVQFQKRWKQQQQHMQIQQQMQLLHPQGQQQLSQIPGTSSANSSLSIGGNLSSLLRIIDRDETL